MSTVEKSIVILGCFDTKGEDFSYLLECIKAKDQKVISINTGVMESTANFTIDFDNSLVAEASGISIEAIKNSGDRGKAVDLMGQGAAKILETLIAENKIKQCKWFL